MSYLQPPKTLASYGLGVKPNHVVVCPVCRKNTAQILYNSHPLMKINQVFPCKSCKDLADQLHADTKTRKWYEKQATGIFEHTNTGEKKVLDQRGREMENPYHEGKANEFGWMQSGHKESHKRHLEKEGKL